MGKVFVNGKYLQIGDVIIRFVVVLVMNVHTRWHRAVVMLPDSLMQSFFSSSAVVIAGFWVKTVVVAVELDSLASRLPFASSHVFAGEFVTWLSRSPVFFEFNDWRVG